MRALTITQPWASLVMAGIKQNETRSWQTHHRGPLVIHAAKGLPGYAAEVLEELGDINERTADIADAIRRHNLFGCALGTVEVVDVFPIDDDLMAFLSPLERRLGDYSMPGRFAWNLASPRRFVYPVEQRGAQGLWTYQGPFPYEDDNR